ncbi:ribonucleases P/MRP protein subunit pop7 [Nowakowskiella sp. JEL0407]|nr:ribonucleases P/MRP protein subunit pop7 [Nowakowskiella sp. JEL0407]
MAKKKKGSLLAAVREPPQEPLPTSHSPSRAFSNLKSPLTSLQRNLLKEKKTAKLATEVNKKRSPQHSPVKENEIYVTRRLPQSVYVKRAQKLLDNNQFSTVEIYGLGAALNTAILVSLALKEANGDAIQWKITTSTVELQDDIDEGSDVRGTMIFKRIHNV